MKEEIMSPNYCVRFHKMIVTLCLLVVSTPAYAGGGTYTQQTVNFLILLAVLLFIGFKIIPPKLRARAEAIQSGLEQGQKELEIAEHRHREVEEKYASLDEEISEILDQANIDVNALKEDFAQLMTQEIERIKISTQGAIEDELNRAKKELQEESVEIAMLIAEDLVREKLTDDDHSRFKQVFIGAVEMEGSDV
jgi:F-type H+-transporting ATPase subunit b